nr:sortase [Arsenicicoccus sp. oral taxon 190]
MRSIRVVTGVLGEVLVTVGVLTLLFVGWQLWWTDVAASAAHDDTVSTLERDFARPGAARPDLATLKDVPVSDPFAVVRIPALGRGYAVPVVEGTTRDVLRRGIGHYRGTAMPGQVGNFALAGHRMTTAAPSATSRRCSPVTG